MLAGSVGSANVFDIGGNLILEAGTSVDPNAINVSNGGVVAVYGAVGVTATSVAPGANLTVNSSGSYGNSAAAGTLAVSGVMNVENGATVLVSAASLSGSSAAVTVLGGGAFQVGNTSSPGAVTLSGGTLSAAALSTLTGAFTVSGSSTLNLNGTALGSVTLDSGTLMGGGSLSNGVDASSASPGAIIQGGDAPGTLTLNGASTLAANVVDQVAIDGNVGYSQYALGAAGSLNLNGAGLTIALGTVDAPFTPYPGDTFTIVSVGTAGASLSGTFATAAVGTQAATSASLSGDTVGTVAIGGAAVAVQIFYPGTYTGATAAALGLSSGASLAGVVLHVQGPAGGGGPTGPIVISGTVAPTGLDVTLNGASGYTQYEVTTGNTLNLVGAALNVQDLVGAIDYGAYTIVDDQTGTSYSTASPSSAFAIQRGRRTSSKRRPPVERRAEPGASHTHPPPRPERRQRPTNARSSRPVRQCRGPQPLRPLRPSA